MSLSVIVCLHRRGHDSALHCCGFHLFSSGSDWKRVTLVLEKSLCLSRAQRSRTSSQAVFLISHVPPLLPLPTLHSAHSHMHGHVAGCPWPPHVTSLVCMEPQCCERGSVAVRLSERERHRGKLAHEHTALSCRLHFHAF